jgi:hypothetical protein
MNAGQFEGHFGACAEKSSSLSRKILSMRLHGSDLSSRGPLDRKKP